MDSRAPEFERLLECIAIDDALDGLLLMGASPAALESVAARLAVLLTAAGAQFVQRIRLGSADTEDSLWGIPGLPPGWGGHGLLVLPEGTTNIVMVPDLSRLSQAAARAGVVMLGTDEVEVQRRGISQRLPTRQRWLAALPDDSAGSVSPHLIERFTIRIRITESAGSNRIEALKMQLAGTTASATSSGTGRLRPGLPKIKSIEDSAIEQLALFDGTSDTSMRAPLALMNVACAWARLDGRSVVDTQTVRSAAAALELIPTVSDGASAEPELPAEPGAPLQPTAPTQAQPEEPAEPQLVTSVDDGAAAHGTDVRELRSNDVIDPGSPIVETLPSPVEIKSTDIPSPPLEYTTLRLPWRQSRTASSGRGSIIGTRRSDVLQDLAVVETLLAAAPFQRQRRNALEAATKDIILRRPDLRAYRRAPPAGELLVLVLDYTSAKKREWLRTLLPYLAEAYEARAEVCIVKVGARHAPNPMRAERLRARNILVPSVAAALDEASGRATPLADGLFQAYSIIRQVLAHGRSSTRRATLVVVSDGRGNVTLEGSRLGRSTGHVGRQGIDDAKRVAREIRSMPNVKRVLINPEPEWMRELPFALASSLGASVVRLGKSDA